MFWKQKQEIYKCIVESDFAAVLYRDKKDKAESQDYDKSTELIIYSGDLSEVLEYCKKNGYLVDLQFSSSAIYLVTKLIPGNIKQKDRSSWEQYQALEIFPEEEYVKSLQGKGFSVWMSFGAVKNIINQHQSIINSVSAYPLDIYKKLLEHSRKGLRKGLSGKNVINNRIKGVLKEQFSNNEEGTKDDISDNFAENVLLEDSISDSLTFTDIKNSIIVFDQGIEFVCIGAVDGIPITVRTFSKKSLDIREDIEDTIEYVKKFDKQGMGFNESEEHNRTNKISKIILMNFNYDQEKLWEQFKISLPLFFNHIDLDILQSIEIKHTDSRQQINIKQNLTQIIMGAFNAICILFIGYYWLQYSDLQTMQREIQKLQEEKAAKRTEITNELKGDMKGIVNTEHIQQIYNYKDLLQKDLNRLSMLQSFMMQGESIAVEIIYSMHDIRLVLHVAKPQSYDLLIQTHSRLRGVLDMIFKGMQIKLESDGQVYDSYMKYTALIA